MREYGQIQSSYWTHPDIRPLSTEAKLIGAYLLTSQHTNGIGCFRLPIGYVSIDLGMDIETVSEGFQELSRNGFAAYDFDAEYVLMPAFLRWNPISNPNAAKARIKEFDLVPSSISIFPSLVNALQKHGKYWDDEFRNRIETLSKGFPKGSERVPEDVRDKETRPDPTQPDPTKTKPNPNGAARKRPLPDDWEPGDSLTEWFESQDFPFDLGDMVQEFRDGCQAKGYRYADFDAAFRNWCKRRRERTPEVREVHYERLN